MRHASSNGTAKAAHRIECEPRHRRRPAPDSQSKSMGMVLLDARATAPAGDLTLVKQLLAGNESAFTSVVDRYHGPLLRFARLFVSNEGVAEEVVQDTWLTVLRALPSFEGRSALKSWIFGILANRAKSRAVREKRIIAFAALSVAGSDYEPGADPCRLTSAGAWSAPPGRWHAYTPESMLLDREALGAVERAMAALPAAQRAVMTLRDVEGLAAAEVCNVLKISTTNQRVLLHRARSKVRAALMHIAVPPWRSARRTIGARCHRS